MIQDNIQSRFSIMNLISTFPRSIKSFVSFLDARHLHEQDKYEHDN